jgi:branched-chain amino acid transport system permease protein
MGLNYFGFDYWWMLIVGPVGVAVIGMALEWFALRRLYSIDPLYGMLLTFGFALFLEGMMRAFYGVSGKTFSAPSALEGVVDLGFMFMPRYRLWVLCVSLGVCIGTWLLIEKTRLGSYLRAATENPRLVEAFGINVPIMVTLTYGFGVFLAAFAGVLSAPIVQLSPLMGMNLIIVVFAVVVIAGMGSIGGAIVTGLALGVVEGLTRIIYPEAVTTVVFLVMGLILLVRPAGLFGTQR